MKVINRRATHDYHVFETLEVGIKLIGPEVKSVKEGRINLSQAYVKIKDGQAFLVNAHIAPYGPAGHSTFETDRTRKLLLHKKEIAAWETKISRSRLTIVPISCYTRHRLVKLKIGLARGKKRWEKRRTIRERDLERDIEREISGGM